MRIVRVLVLAVATTAGYAASCAAAAWCWGGLWTRATDVGAAGATVDVLLGLVATAGAWLLLSWLAVAVLACAVVQVPALAGSALAVAAEAVTPSLVRRLVAAAVGAAVLAPAVPSLAVAEEVRVVTTGYPSVDRPVLPAAPQVDAPPEPPQPPEAPERAEPVVVEAGDSLWSIAAARLGPRAGATQVAAEWPRWWSANRAVIGDDPHLLRPGQVLQPPTGA